jgi:hypothetical protein
MWKKIKEIKKTRDGTVYRFLCEECEKEVDSYKTPKTCKHSTLYNINSVWCNILRSALGIKSGRKRLKIDIDKKFVEKLFLKQESRCALSGMNIRLGLNASLDRIDSSRGYTKDNVQWLHKDINLLKGSLEEKYFLEICENVHKHNRKN